MTESTPSRDQLANLYLEQLPYEPYEVQERALLEWFDENPGVLVCAPTGTGKTLIAEAACFEALHTGRKIYYTTPLIALTDQKFQEIQASAVRWGFSPDDVGLVTGNRKVNPDAKVLVVVAEILLNRLLHPEAFDFRDVYAVVMDEFHNFADQERGVVWELSLGLLPLHVRLMLLSATVGNAVEFLEWLKRSHGRQLHLVQSQERRVPLTYHWVADQLLSEQLEIMAEAEGEDRMTPALVFCFNRNECWDVAEQLKGKSLVSKEMQKRLADELDRYDWTEGAGPKLKQILQRGVGVHHAGILPRFRRVVEELFQKKMLSVCVCTETLAAGMNLPARSVLLTTLLKGPHGKMKLVEASSAHQMFGRAGRPQFDTKGHVFAIAHEDDVKILRFMEKYNEIPEDTKDPLVLKAKKRMKKKMPTRNSKVQYWSESQFQQLQQALPGHLASRGPLPWRLLAYMISLTPDVSLLNNFVRKRLMTPARIEQGVEQLKRMLITLWSADYIQLEPEPPFPRRVEPKPKAAAAPEPKPEPPKMGLLGTLLAEANIHGTEPEEKKKLEGEPQTERAKLMMYEPQRAIALPSLQQLLLLRSVNPLYGVFLLQQMDLADEHERLQLLESVLEVPGSLSRDVAIPSQEELPPGPLATERLNEILLTRGLATQQEIEGVQNAERRWENVPPMPVAQKVLLYFRSEYPNVSDVFVNPVWVAGELLRYSGNFNKYVRGRDLTKQEGIIFRHLLRLILLCEELVELTPPGWEPAAWEQTLRQLAEQLTASCRAVDPDSTDKLIEQALVASDIVSGEEGHKARFDPRIKSVATDAEDVFGAGLFEE